MAGQITNYQAVRILNATLTGTALAAVANVYVGLYTDASGITAAKYGGTFTEVPNSNGYARVLVPASSWGAPALNANTSPPNTGTTMANSALVSFGTPTGAGWGTITGCFFTDSGTYGAGNILAYDEATATIVAAAGTPFTIPVGNTMLTIM